MRGGDGGEGGAWSRDEEWVRSWRYIYVFGVLPHLQSPPLGWVEDQEALQEVLAVSGHVEGDAVLPPQDPLSQLLSNHTGAQLACVSTHQCPSWTGDWVW